MLLTGMPMTRTMATAEPFLFPGGAVGCLLIHGFTGTPREMRGLGEYLAGKGFSVLGLRLAGHATRPEDMIRSNWTDWAACVEDGYHLLRGISRRVYLIGLSMGGALSLLMSTCLDVNGVVAMSTPYRLPHDWRLNYTEWLSKIWSYLPKNDGTAGAGWFDARAGAEHVSYPMNPVRSIGELNKLLAAMRAALPQVRVPVLLIHSADDRYVLPENMGHLYGELVNAPDKAQRLVTGSGHIVTRDAARQQVFEATLDFIVRIEHGRPSKGAGRATSGGVRT